MKYNGIELVPIAKVQAFEEPREMLVWNNRSSSTTTIEVVAIIKNSRTTTCIDVNLTAWDNCAEIPKQKTRKRNKDEIEFYLWERNKTECVQFSFAGRAWVFDYGYGFENLDRYKFRTIDKNGKVTEFKIPEIEVTE